MSHDTQGDLFQWDQAQLLQSCLNAISDPYFVKDRQHQFVAFNQAFVQMLGQTTEALRGKSDFDFVSDEQAKLFWQIDDRIFRTGQTETTEEQIDHADGTLHTIWTRKFPLRDPNGDIVGLVGCVTDITDLRRRRDEVTALERQVRDQMAQIDLQNTLLDQIGVPIIEVWDGIVLLPLVGNIDTRRAQRVMERMLEAITSSQADYVLLDISGVPLVDTHVAASLMRAMQASRLLGCEPLIVGISPEIAQTLVHLGLDFSAVTAYSSLREALLNLIGR